MPSRTQHSTLHLVGPKPSTSSDLAPVATSLRNLLARFEGRALVSINEAAEALALSRATLYRENARGRLPFVHIGTTVRVKLDALHDYLESLDTFNAKATGQRTRRGRPRKMSESGGVGEQAGPI